MRGFRLDLRFALIPAAAALAAFVMTQARGPFWANADPSYAYLFNSLLLVSGFAPRLVEHPGTPLEVAGAGVVVLLTPFHSAESRVATVLRDPEWFLHVLHGTLVMSYCALLIVLGHFARDVLGSVRGGLLAQSTPFLSYQCLSALSSYSTEPALLVVTTILSIVILLWLRRAESSGAPDGLAIVFGMTVAVAAATKITSVTLLVVPLILFGPSAAALRVLASFVITFLVAISPALPRIKVALSWYGRILAHTGTYGEGPAGVVESGTYFRALERLVRLDLLFFAISVGALAFLLVNRSSDGGASGGLTPRKRALLALSVVPVLQLIIVAKHPDNHYLVPAIGLAGIAVALVWTDVERWLRTPPAVNHAAFVLFWAVVCAFRMASPGHLAPWGDFAYQVSTTRQNRARIRDLDADIARRAGEGRGPLLVQYYGSSSQAYALKFGDALSGALLMPKLCAAWGPQGIFYDVWTRQYSTLCGPLTASAVAQRADAHDEILFRGLTFIGPLAGLGPAEFELKPRLRGTFLEEGVYRAVGRTVRAPTLASNPE